MRDNISWFQNTATHFPSSPILGLFKEFPKRYHSKVILIKVLKVKILAMVIVKFLMSTTIVSILFTNFLLNKARETFQFILQGCIVNF